VKYSISERLKAALGHGKMPEDAAMPIVDWLTARFDPETVLDVGCGGGAFLRRFKNHGPRTIGLDIAPVRPEGVDDYKMTDLTMCDVQSFPKADLTICAEVAEHLPVSVAAPLVKRLCESSSVVVFGGGIPAQGGWGHINERWPSYWATRFAEYGYEPHSDLRVHLWNDPLVAPWYAQDLLIYCTRETAWKHDLHEPELLDVVHPRSWLGIGPMGIWKRMAILVDGETQS